MNIFKKIFGVDNTGQEIVVAEESKTKESFVTTGRKQYQFQKTLSDRELLSSTAFTVTDLRAKALSTLNFYAVQVSEDGTETKLPTSHPINRILYEPNSRLTYNNFFGLLSQYFDFFGNAIAVPIKSEISTETIGLELIPMSRVEIDVKSGEVFYKIDMGTGSRQIFLAEDVFHLKNLSALKSSSVKSDYMTMYMGTALVENCIEDIELELQYKRFLGGFFANNGVPPLIAQTQQSFDGTIDDTTKKDFVKYLRSIIDEERILGFMPDGTELAQLTGTASAATSSVVQGKSQEFKENICETFHVPYSKISGNYQNRATSVVVNEQFYTDSIYPTADAIVDTLTSWFQNQFKIYNVKIVYDLLTFQDPDLQVQQLQNLFLAGIVTREEVREKLGYKNELVPTPSIPATTDDEFEVI